MVQRIHDNGHVFEGTYEGWFCPRCADFKTESEIEDGNSCAIHKIVLEWREGGQLVLPAVGVPGAARAALRGAARLRGPAGALQRGALVHPGRAPGPVAEPVAAQVGRAGAVGPVAGRLRLDRRAPQLLHGALLRARGRGPDRALLARRRPPDRQGHPQVPRRDLAGAADGRRDRGAAPGGDPRLPAARRAQDVQVARQRHRAVPGGGALRRRRPALLRRCARSASARTARSRRRASRPATRPSSPTSTATSRAARWR